ncbi:MAG: hypothetical protein CMI90_06900 [Pelagibacteraceae bacterium]|nr:hypothetical protein [Pelagibacteraceae bacterium]|tara:strand:+ start:233 stop:1006 length:774 start_codon:yes stop_codon:yes gene_type:complete
MKRSQLSITPQKTSYKVFEKKVSVFLSLSIQRLIYRKGLFISSLRKKLRGIDPLGVMHLTSAAALIAIFFFVSSASKANADEWVDIDKYENWEFQQYGDSVIFITTFGQITHGDTLIFSTNAHDCNKFNQLFQLYTTTNNKNIKKLEDKRIHIVDNGDPTEAEIISVQEAMQGHIVMFDLGAFAKDEVIRYYEFYGRFQVGLLDSEHVEEIGKFSAKDFFDIPRNFWKTPNIKDALDIGQAYCLELNKNLQATYERI